MNRLRPLFDRVDLASLAVFRIIFGLLACGEMVRYLAQDYVTILWVMPEFHFKYMGFPWVTDLPDPLIYTAWGVGAFAALCIALGLFYRFACVTFFVVQAYFFLLDETKWMNHFYLTCLFGLILIFVPCNRMASLDVLRKPGIRSGVAPAWTLWMLRAQMGIVYFFGGVAKINSDWLLCAEPMRGWLSEMGGMPLLGGFLTGDLAPWFFSWGGLIFDLFVVPLLLWRRTRRLAFILAVLFHLTNAVIFSIGVFPWLAIASTTLFLDPGWPRRFFWKKVELADGAAIDVSVRCRRVVTGTLVGFFLLQLLLPLRPFLYPGDSNWTEEGHRFSWHMMLRRKSAKCRFFVRHADVKEALKVYTGKFLTDYQEMKMAINPDMILQLAHHIGRTMEARGLRNVQVFAKARASLNGHPEQYLVDRKVDLFQEKRSLRHYDWIVPLQGVRSSGKIVP